MHALGWHAAGLASFHRRTSCGPTSSSVSSDVGVQHAHVGTHDWHNMLECMIT